MDEFQARRLVEAYADMILRISYQYLKQACDAEDICQTVFLKYLSGHCKFDSIEHEKAWIIRTTINTCKDHVKSAFFRRTVPLEEASGMTAPVPPDTDLLHAMQGYTVSACTCFTTRATPPGKSAASSERRKPPSANTCPGDDGS